MANEQTDELAKALAKRERAYNEAISRLRELASDDAQDEVYDLTCTLREAVALVGCLRRLTLGRTVAEIHHAFGAPGDFGYDTPIGQALDSAYRAKASPAAPEATDDV